MLTTLLGLSSSARDEHGVVELLQTVSRRASSVSEEERKAIEAMARRARKGDKPKTPSKLNGSMVIDSPTSPSSSTVGSDSQHGSSHGGSSHGGSLHGSSGGLLRDFGSVPSIVREPSLNGSRGELLRGWDPVPTVRHHDTDGSI